MLIIHLVSYSAKDFYTEELCYEKEKSRSEPPNSIQYPRITFQIKHQYLLD